MLDRLADLKREDIEAFERLPLPWRELFEGLKDRLGREMDQRSSLAQLLERTVMEMREQLVELDALRRARSAAESANLVRGQILSTVSRTMRGPADALLGLTGLLRSGPLLPAQRAYVDALQSAAEALRSGLNEVADFSRLESGTLPLEPIDFDLRVMIEDLAAALGGEAQAKGITLRLSWRPETPRRVTGDPGRVRQVLAALVRDGLARMERGEVVMEVSEDPGHTGRNGIRVVVEDSGPAIPADLLPTLFEPFMRSDLYARQDGELALPIARQLCRLMGGELRAENSGGSGSRFTVRLPLPRRDGSPPGSRPAWEATPSSLAPGTLLVVEADASQRASWASIAEAAGYRASGYGNRVEAIAELKRRAEAGRPVDMVIFSDHDAEDYERIGLEMSNADALGKPALIMLPAVGNPGDARRLVDAGFRGYLVKPVAPADLRETLETLRRAPRSAWHTLFLTRHSLAESRSEEGREEALDAGLRQLVEG